MNNNLTRYIKYLLDKKGKVSLQGIGTISYSQEQAYFSPGKDALYPPRIQFSFTDEVNDVDALPELMVKNEKITIKEARDQVVAFSQKILNNLLNYDIVKIEGIGYLEKKNNNTHFIPSESIINNAYKGLQPLKAAPILRDKKKLTASPSSIEPPIKWNGEWLTYFLSLLLGALMIVAYHHFLDPTINYTPVPKPKQEIPAVTSDLQEEETGYNVVPDGDTVTQVEEVNPADSNDISEEDVTSSESENVGDTSNVKRAEPKEETECIIIVGAFTRTINALEMVDRLKRDGYTSYSENIRDTYRVGIKFQCESYDLEKMIREIRRKYNRKAWYLVPQITI